MSTYASKFDRFPNNSFDERLVGKIADTSNVPEITIPIVIHCSTPASTDASNTRTIVAPFAMKLIDVMVKCTGDGETGEAITVSNASGTWASIDISGGAANAILRMTSADETYEDVALGETITITTTDATYDGGSITIYAVKI